MIKQSFWLIYERTAILPSHGNDVSGLWHLIIYLLSARHSEITVAEQSLHISIKRKLNLVAKIY